MSLVVLPRQLLVDSNGTPRSGAQAAFYQSGSNTPITVYTTAAYSVEHSNPVETLATGLFPAIYVNPTVNATYKIVVTDSNDVGIYSEDNVPALGFSGDDLGAIFYPQTPSELALGYTPVNYKCRPGYVDRYLVNTTPGTTDMTEAFTRAGRSSSHGRAKVGYGMSYPYRLASTVNWTELGGVICEEDSGGEASSDDCALVIDHDSHAFDVSGTREVLFRDCTVETVTGKNPLTFLLGMRNSVGSDAGLHRLENVRFSSHVKFAVNIYLYGSEQCIVDKCVLYNSKSGGKIFHINATNPLGYSSAFMTVATGAQSNALATVRDCSIFCEGTGGTEVMMEVENAQNILIEGGLMHCPSGSDYIHISGTTGVNFLSVKDVRGETDGGGGATYFIRSAATAALVADAQLNWNIQGVKVPCAQEFIYLGDTAELTELKISGSGSVTSGKLLSAKYLNKSTIDHSTSTVVGRAGGAIANSTFIGSRSQISFLGTETDCTGFDQATGEVWHTDDKYTAASTACTGAVTTAVIWKIAKIGSLVTLTLPPTTGLPTASASFTYGVAIPSAYRPSADHRHACIIQDNGAVLNQQGFVSVLAATGVISVFKDLVGTANFTAANTGGLPGSQSVSWRV